MKQKNSILRSAGVTIVALLLSLFSYGCVSGPSSYDIIPGQNVNTSSHYFNVPNGAGTWYLQIQTFGSLSFNNLQVSFGGPAVGFPGGYFFYPGGSVPMTITATTPYAGFCQSGIISLNFYNGLGQFVCSFNYTVNVRDNAKELLTVTGHGTYYAGADFHIHRLSWTSQNGWQHQAITPNGGWGSVQVDGWLGAEYYDNKIFFRSRDSKLYALWEVSGVWYLGQILAMNNVRSDIQLRPGEIWYVGTDSKIHRVYWNGSGWSYEAINPVNGWQGINAAGSIALARQASNVFFRTTGNQVMNLVGSTGNWNLWGIYPPTGCGGDMVYDDATGLFYKGTDNLVHKVWWNGSTWAFDNMTPNWNAGPVANHLTKFPGEQRVFYKGTDGKTYNIYWNGSQWEPQPLNTFNSVGGDLFAADGKIFFVSQGNAMFGAKVGEYGWNGSGWYAGFPLFSAPDVKGCSSSYRLGDPGEETEPAAEASSVPEQPLAIDKSKTISNVAPYPNPASGKLSVSCVLTKDAPVTVSLFNTVGERVKEISAGELAAGQQQVEMGLEDVAPGVYLLRVTAGTESSDVQKVIVQ